MSNKDYYSPILCHGAKQRTHSSVALYDVPEKVWAASIFFVSVLARECHRLCSRMLLKVLAINNLKIKMKLT